MRCCFALLTMALLLCGCASDERVAAMNEPDTNLPLARPEPVVNGPTPTGAAAPAPLYYPPGTYYPVDAP